MTQWRVFHLLCPSTKKHKVKQGIEREAEGGPAEEYYTTLTHYRGYAFADRVDPDRINNWQKFFSLPDKEIRRRFFTDKPDYSGL